LLATDKQFRPVADFLMHKGKQIVNTVNGNGVDCVRAVYVGISTKDVPELNTGSATFSDVYGPGSNIKRIQSECASGLPDAIKPVAEASGVLPKPKHVIDTKAAMVLDPRVYERARRMIPAAAKPKSKEPK
jgi:hypothetical protein